MRINFPFSAVVGQDQLKLALLLNTVNPDIGGVLIEGPRGTAKSTLARSLGDLLPAGKFVNLPLGATEEQVTGSLDVEKILQEAKINFAPGLLAKAHHGVLYVDEVNLLPDHLVDLLLDVAASGVNYVERDSVSHQHESRFLLIGTMNPDEGELRGQLLDRFGMSVALTNAYSADERSEIVKRRLRFDSAPDTFARGFNHANQSLIAKISKAQTRLKSVSINDDMISHIGVLCADAGVEGLRADITLTKAACAYTAWQERDAVVLDDVQAVVDLVLRHRRQQSERPTSRSGPKTQTPGTGSGSEQQQNQHERGEGDFGSMPPQNVTADWSQHAPDLLKKVCLTPRERSRSIQTETSRAYPEHVNSSTANRTASRQQGNSRIDWLASVVRNRRAPESIDELRFKSTIRNRPLAIMIAVDCSASTLRGGALSAAKGVVHNMILQAYRKRASVGLLTFSGLGINMIKPIGKVARNTVKPDLNGIAGGGGTPLLEAWRRSVEILRQHKQSHEGVELKLFMLTDGRANVSGFYNGYYDGYKRQSKDIQSTIIDIEFQPVRLAKAQEFARLTGSQYAHL